MRVNALPKSTEPTARVGGERSRRTRRGQARAVLGALLVGGTVLAEPSSTGRSDAEAVLATETAASTADIVLVGAVREDRELALLLRELLARDGLEVQLSEAERFEPAALFGAESPGATRIFVVLDDAHQVRLHLRGPNGERYLLRKVALPNGLDPVGRELLAQVVESSVAALRNSTEGLSREEANAELERESAPPRATVPSPRAAPARRTAAPPPVPPAPSPWEFHLGLRYAVSSGGAELGISHGPGVVAGARYRRGASLGIELGAERHFAQSLSTPALEAEIQRSSFYALVEGGLTFSARQSGFIALGPALAYTRAHPVTGARDVTLGAPQSNLTPALRLELRYELASRHWLLDVAAVLELSLVRTRYELAGAGAPELLSAPAVFRPGAALMLAVQ